MRMGPGRRLGGHGFCRNTMMAIRHLLTLDSPTSSAEVRSASMPLASYIVTKPSLR